MAANELRSRRYDAVRAWSAFVEHAATARSRWSVPRS